MTTRYANARTTRSSRPSLVARCALSLLLLSVALFGLLRIGMRVSAVNGCPNNTQCTAAIENVGSPAPPFTTAGSGTSLKLVLAPAGSACSGDALAGYRWSTYIVPSTVDPATLTFGSTGPAPTTFGASLRSPLYDPDQNSIVNQSPAASTGLITPAPVLFSFSALTSANIPNGTYNLGVACTSSAGSVVDRVWNTRITVTADAADSPGGFTLAPAVAPPDPTTTTTTTTTTLAPTTTTTTTVPPGGSTTSTTRAPSTTTTTVVTACGASTTSTTAVSSSSSSTTVGSSTTTTDPCRTTTTTTPASTTTVFVASRAAALANTGPSRAWPTLVLGLLALILGRAIILSARRIEILD